MSFSSYGCTRCAHFLSRKTPCARLILPSVPRFAPRRVHCPLFRHRQPRPFTRWLLAVWHVAGALVRVALAWLRGRPILLPDNEQVFRRRCLCYHCHYFDADSGRCQLCLCFVSLKTALATERCPIYKW